MTTGEWRPCHLDERYEVNDLGQVRRGAKVLKPYPAGKGYLKVGLWNAQRRLQPYVHQLVAVAFIGPPPPQHTVDHIDWDKTNNRAENLRWLPEMVNSFRWQHLDDIAPPDDHVPITEEEHDAIVQDLQAAGW